MKKTLLSLLTTVLCVANFVGLATGCDNDNEKNDENLSKITISEIFEANTHANLQKKYDSYSVTYVYDKHPHASGAMYFGENCSYLEYTTKKEGYLFVDNEYVYDLMEGEAAAITYLDEETITLVNENNPHIIVLREDAFVVNSVEKQDDQIVATVTPTQENIDGALIMFQGEYNEGDNVELIFVLNEDLTLQKFTVNYLPVNGQETKVATCTVDYNVEMPQNCKTLYDFYTQTEDLRTVTYIANAGTSNEKRWTVQAPKGVEVYPLIAEQYDSNVYTDAECTQVYEGTDYSTDETLYLKDCEVADQE